MLVFQSHCITHQGTRLCSAFIVGESLRVSMSMLRRINIHIVIHLDDMLITGQTPMEENLMFRDTVVFLLLCFFKLGEVHFESSSGNRVSWSNNKFFEDVSTNESESHPTPWDHNYSRISSKLHERGSGLTVKKLKGPYRVGTPSTNILEYVRSK